jgi:phospholipid transport system substrate-binding protein
VSKIESYNHEKIVYVRERIDKRFAEVDTKVAPKKGEEVPIQYKLHFASGEWKVYDVVIDNVSLVNNYRSQFSRILATASFDELLRRMQEKGLEKEG